MTYSHRGRRGIVRIPGTLVGGLLIVVAAMTPTLASHSPTSSSPTAGPRTDTPVGERRGAPAEAGGGLPVVTTGPHGGLGRGLGAADGVVRDGTTVFDDGVPAVANLDPALLAALRDAATEATGDGVEFLVESGWRSPAYQMQLLREAISTYGSEREAARWVATPETSPHVSGDAVDIGPSTAITWLSRHGAAYGLCQIYRNEPWHFELRPSATDRGCPPMYADATHDPRMH